MVEDGHSTFLSFRLVGPGLDPDEVTAALHARPDAAHRKGESFHTRTGTLVRRKDHLWLARSPEGLGRDHGAHVGWMTDFLGRRAEAVRTLAGTAGIEMDVSSFWHGPHGRPAPVDDAQLEWLVRRLGGTYERDHSNDERPSGA